MKLSEEQLAKGRKRFLDGYPNIRLYIDALTQQEADAMGITLERLRETETMRYLRKVADATGIDSTELFWSGIADTAEELGQMLERQDAAMKLHLGI